MAFPLGYLNFDLPITRSGDQYRVFVIDAPAGESNTTFDLPIAVDEAKRLAQSIGARRNLEPSDATGAAGEPPGPARIWATRNSGPLSSSRRPPWA